MKVIVSLPEEDIEFLDSFAQAAGIGSRSAVVHKAVEILRWSHLGQAYEDAWRDWETSDDADAWESVGGDGLGT